MKLLIQHEELLAELYRHFASVFPDNDGIWRKLVVDEMAHADVLRQLEQYLVDEKIAISGQRFNSVGVQASLDYVKKRIAAVKSTETSYVEALSLANDLETALIESKCFEIFETDSPKMKQEFVALREHTQRHAQMIKGLLDAQREVDIN